MDEIKEKLRKLAYEISLVKTSEHDQLTGVINRLDELQDVVNKKDLLQRLGGRASEADYWSERCKLVEAIREETPCDPDITTNQKNAWNNYNKFILLNGLWDYR